MVLHGSQMFYTSKEHCKVKQTVSMFELIASVAMSYAWTFSMFVILMTGLNVTNVKQVVNRIRKTSKWFSIILDPYFEVLLNFKITHPS